jgi:transposase
MQVHWFHGQLQAQIEEMGARVGLQVVLVKAAHTSMTCSRCGQQGTRVGKRFYCKHAGCGIELDADLNASRNIARAPSLT